LSYAGGVLLAEVARRSGLAGQLSRLLGRWRFPLATHDPGKKRWSPPPTPDSAR
jgi:hypothetical protein